MEFSHNARVIVRDIGKGLDLSTAGHNAVLTVLESAIRYNPDGTVYLADENGNRRVTADMDGKVIDQPLAEFILDVVKQDPSYTTRKAAPKAETGPKNLTHEMAVTVAAQKQVRAANNARKVEGNPWNRDSWNLTHQMVIAKGDPDRAARLRGEAGVGK